jgi:hypothetical protein
VSTQDPFSVRVVPGQDTLTFAPVPGNSEVTSSGSFTILVNPAGSVDFSNLQWTFASVAAPVSANAGPNQTGKVGALVTLDGSGSTNQSGVGTLSYSWKFTSLPQGSSATLSNSTAVMPTFVVDVAGSYVITLTVSNGVASSSASVTITTGNTPPVANAGPNQTVAIGATVVLDGSGSSDVDRNPLTYSWTLMSAPTGSTAALKGANTVAPTFVADLSGSYVVQLIVNDGTTNSQPSSVTISTSSTPPVANAGPNQVIRIGSLVQLDGSGSTDVNQHALTYHWTLVAVPQGSTAALSNPTLVNPTFIADLAGIYVAQLIVSDGSASSSPSTVTISTAQILAPVANAGPNESVALHSVVVLQGGGTDPQGLQLTFQWSIISAPSGSTAVLSSTTIANPSFSPDVKGLYVVQLVVNNGYLSSFPATASISTSSTAPVANAGTNQLAKVGTTVTLDGTGSSASSGNPLTYSWTLLSRPAGSSAALTGATTAKPTFVVDVGGTYVAQLIVNDGIASSAPATVTVASQTLTLTPNPLSIAGTPGMMTVTLSSPAGTSGQVVNLAVLDTTIATVPATVTVPATATGVSFSITPVAVGSTNILASATGFFNALATVNVTAVAPPPPPPTLTIQFSSTSLSITGTVTQNLTLLLSASAPAGGQTINVSSSNTAVATVPATVTFAAGSTSVTVPVTGIAVGSATIHASALPSIKDTTASVTVTVPSDIQLPSNTSTGSGDTVSFPLTLAQPAPAGGVFIMLSSSDTTKLTISPTTIFISEGSLTPRAPPLITGVAAGSASITASAFGLTSTTVQVQITP